MSLTSEIAPYGQPAVTIAANWENHYEGLATKALSLIDAMMTNDPNEPVSDAGHTALDLWKHEAENIRAALASSNRKEG